MALEVLREAVEQGADKRPDHEKRLTRARTAVEKAAQPPPRLNATSPCRMFGVETGA